MLAQSGIRILAVGPAVVDVVNVDPVFVGVIRSLGWSDHLHSLLAAMDCPDLTVAVGERR